MGDDVGCHSHLKTATCGSPRHASKASWGNLKPKAGLLPPPAASTTTPDGVSHKGIRNWTQRLLANKNIRYLLYYLCLASQSIHLYIPISFPYLEDHAMWLCFAYDSATSWSRTFAFSALLLGVSVGSSALRVEHPQTSQFIRTETWATHEWKLSIHNWFHTPSNLRLGSKPQSWSHPWRFCFCLE